MRWLNDYVKADMPIKEFVADMTMSGSKVETYHKMSDPISRRNKDNKGQAERRCKQRYDVLLCGAWSYKG